MQDILIDKKKRFNSSNKICLVAKLSSLDHEDDDEGTVWNKEKEIKIECLQHKHGELYR